MNGKYTSGTKADKKRPVTVVLYWSWYWLRKHVSPAPWLYVNRLRNRSKQIAKRCSNTARNCMAVGRNLLARVDPLFSESCLWSCGGWGEGGLLEGDGAWGVLGAEGVLSLACGGSSFSLIPLHQRLVFFPLTATAKTTCRSTEEDLIHMKRWGKLGISTLRSFRWIYFFRLKETSHIKQRTSECTNIWIRQRMMSCQYIWQHFSRRLYILKVCLLKMN